MVRVDDLTATSKTPVIEACVFLLDMVPGWYMLGRIPFIQKLNKFMHQIYGILDIYLFLFCLRKGNAKFGTNYFVHITSRMYFGRFTIAKLWLSIK